MRDCHNCKYHFLTSNPYERCLHFYGQGVAVEMLKKGLIGECDEFAAEDSDDGRDE